jgi:DNA-binding MarR family transcriptional regulator
MSEEESRAWLALARVVELLPAALDHQLQRDSGLTHFEYMVLSMLQFDPQRSLRMSTLAERTNSTLPRLSNVCARLAKRGLVERRPAADDRRATDVLLTSDGRRELIRATSGHVAFARELVIDALTPEQLGQLAELMTLLGERVQPDGEPREPRWAEPEASGAGKPLGRAVRGLPVPDEALAHLVDRIGQREDLGTHEQ